MLAGWLGFETDKTAATIAGNTASTASQVAFGMGEIAIDAAIGAAGAEAFFAPYGPEVSAPAAVAEYSKIMGWGFGLGGAGLAQGTNFVPSDMMTLIHQGERVVPAADNSAIMSALNGGSGGGGIVINQNITVNAVDGPSVVAHANKFAPDLCQSSDDAIAAQPEFARGNIEMAYQPPESSMSFRT